MATFKPDKEEKISQKYISLPYDIFICLWFQKLLPCLFIVLSLAILSLNYSYAHNRSS